MVIIHVAVSWNVMSRVLIAICRRFEWNIFPCVQCISQKFEKKIWRERSINIYQISRHDPKYRVEYYRGVLIKQGKTRDLGSGLNPALLVSL